MADSNSTPEEKARDDFVGARDDGIRLWRATEAMRSGETRLQAQTGNLTAIETRASSMLGWMAPILTALAIASTTVQWHKIALISGSPLILASICCAIALRPKSWTFPGYTLGQLENWNYGTELQYREALAQAYQRSIDSNSKTLGGLVFWVTLAWGLVAVAPVIAFTASTWIKAS